MSERGGQERVEFFQDVDSLWRFRWVGANNEPTCQSEAYQNHADALDIADKMFRPVSWFEKTDDEWKQVRP